MAKATAPAQPAPAPEPETVAPEKVLIAAAVDKHGPHGALKDVKVHGPHVTGLNDKGQTVITTVETATAHAVKLGWEPGHAELPPQADPAS